MNSIAKLLQPTITPKPHQWATAEFLLSNERCYNLSSCGSGKTLGCILALNMLWDHNKEKKFLVVAPLSVIGATWMEHMEQFAPSIPVMRLDNSGTRKRIARDILSFKGVVLINPDGVQTLWHELVAWCPGLVIIDELAGYYRNYGTNRWKAMAALFQKCNPAVWAFTGTPITKNVMDAYAQCMLVNPSKLPVVRSGRSILWKQLRDMLMYNPVAHIWLPKGGALERVQEMMQPAIRFSRADVMKDIKTPILIRKQVALTTEQKTLIGTLMAKGKAEFGKAVIGAKEAMTLITKICQIALGEVYDSKGDPVMVPSTPRVQALMDLFEEVDEEPTIVAIPYIPAMLALKQTLLWKGLRVEVIYGDVKPRDRQDIIKRFQLGEIDMLLCHPKTLAHGVTLTRSSIVVWYGPHYDLELYAQLNDRIYRYGQEGQPLIVELSSTAIENKIYGVLRGKEEMSGSFLELFGASL